MGRVRWPVITVRSSEGLKAAGVSDAGPHLARDLSFSTWSIAGLPTNAISAAGPCGHTGGADGARLVIISMQGPARHSHASKPLLHLFSSSPPPPPISPGASCSGGMPWQVLYWHVWPRKAARRSPAAQRPAAVREQQQPLSWIKTLSCWPCPGHTRQTQPEWDVHPVPAECWAGVVDAGPALIRHRVTVHGL